MREYDRTVLLERIEREGATVGARMPETLAVDGETVCVREAVLELTGDDLDAAGRERAGALVRTLRRARQARLDRLRTGEDLDREAGEALAETIAGIDRALNALEQLDAPGVAEQAEQRQRADQQRWMSFLREALGHDQERRR